MKNTRNVFSTRYFEKKELHGDSHRMIEVLALLCGNFITIAMLCSSDKSDCRVMKHNRMLTSVRQQQHHSRISISLFHFTLRSPLVL